MDAARLPVFAWRNIWRHRRRTFLTLSSIAFGSLIAVVSTGVGDAQWREMIDLAARLGGGHVSLQHPEYLDTPTLGRTVRDVEKLRRVALEDRDVTRATPRITGHAMLASPRHSQGAAFIAYDPTVEDTTTLSLLEAVDGGEAFTRADARGIYLGARLAERLGVRPGRKIVVTLTDREGEIVQEAVRVTGLIETGSPSVDEGLCLFPIDMLRASLGYAPDEATRLAIFLGDHRRVDRVAERLGQRIDGRAEALAWHRLHTELAGFITMKVVGNQIMEGVILLLVAAGIFNTLYVSVMERRREFGILLAVGFGSGRLFGLVMWESLWVGICGLVLGALVTAWPYHYLSTTGIDIAAAMDVGGAEVAGVAVTTTMRASIYPENLVAIAIVVLLATLLSGLYPAWSAARMEPVETIRLV